jgi:hypothetical protein
VSESGGDAACWLERVCDTCGGVITADESHECRRPAERQPSTGDAGQPAAASSAGPIACSE